MTLNDVKGVIPRVMMVVDYFLLFYFMCSFYVALVEDFKLTSRPTWKRACRSQSLLKMRCLQIHLLFLSTPQIAPIGEMIIEVKSTT
jgi:hypothetical protein